MDREAWQVTVHRAAKSWTQLAHTQGTLQPVSGYMALGEQKRRAGHLPGARLPAPPRRPHLPGAPRAPRVLTLRPPGLEPVEPLVHPPACSHPAPTRRPPSKRRLRTGVLRVLLGSLGP